MGSREAKCNTRKKKHTRKKSTLLALGYSNAWRPQAPDLWLHPWSLRQWSVEGSTCLKTLVFRSFQTCQEINMVMELRPWCLELATRLKHLEHRESLLSSDKSWYRGCTFWQAPSCKCILLACHEWWSINQTVVVVPFFFVAETSWHTQCISVLFCCLQRG